MADYRYDPKQIEPRWQRVWADERTWEVENPQPGAGRRGDERPKSYVLVMLPYPSGEPHIGHLKVYSVGDAVAHFHRRHGRRVLQPMGYDAFGLPAENHAISTGQHPRDSTDAAIAAFRQQFREWGISIDWSREIATHEPEYYRWTQWIFLQLYDRGLAYRKEAAVKWCPNDQTVLANEQVIDGRCERCGYEVEARQLEQWFFRITDYADRLLDDLATIDWPDHVVTMQRNWIGRSQGAEVVFRCEELGIDYPVFTTRPDTLFGATFFVMAPEHPDVFRLNDSPEVHEYVNKALTENAQQRGAEDKEKTGVPLGCTVTNPVNGQQIPMYVADYVLMEYGTGAIMAVPGHDERDHEFAEKFGLEIRRVIEGPDGDDELPYTGDGPMVNSGRFDGKHNREAYDEIVGWLESEGLGKPAVNYRLRDWLLSRQRYWGCPIPVVHCEDCGIVPVPEEELPVLLPDIEDYAPKGKSPLETAEDWIRVPCPQCGKEGRREADTMDTFVDSSWYFLRYCDPHNDTAPFERSAIDEWCPVDQYIGGIEHAVLHLLYARYFIKVLNDLGIVGFREPFSRLFNHGWVDMGGAKMSKSKGNAISPDDFVREHGADALRLYILFIGPADARVEWQATGLEGMSRFLRRLWRVALEVAAQSPEEGAGELAHKANETIVKVTDDIGRRFAYNTAIAAVMELVNEIARDPSAPGARFAVETAVSLIQPAAPHVAEELWGRLGHERLWEQPWPTADPSLLQRETFELVVQVNGKVRDRLQVPADLPEDELVARAKESPKVQAQLNGGEIRQTIVVPRKLVNLVVN